MEGKNVGSICGADCTKCGFTSACAGCTETDGAPFGRPCFIAGRCRKGENALQALKDKLMAAFNDLGIPDMPPVTELYALKGSVINLAYTLPSGGIIGFWDDDKIYLGYQLPKQGSDRTYGIVADERYLMVSEYSGYGSDAEIVVFKRWEGKTE